MEKITREYVLRCLPRRAEDANKGSFGTVAAFAGSSAYRGAAALAAEGALRGGAGLVFLATVPDAMQLALMRTPECCVLPCRADADGWLCPDDVRTAAARFAPGKAVLLAGPGLGDGAGRVLSILLGGDFVWKGCLLDADALNAVASGTAGGVSLPENAILTPHPGEMARLTGLTVAQVQADRPGVAARYAAQHDCVVVLKGSGTVIAAPDGSLLLNTTGNPGLARGGSGDILAGMIAALLAQGLTPFHAAACGVWLHGAAADRCAARRSRQAMLPHEILEDLGVLLAEEGL